MRSITGMCAGAGTLVGGCIPMAWGDSGFSVVSLLVGMLGGVAGLWVGLRLQA